MKIHFVNNHGEGFADTIEVDEGTTLQALFNTKIGGESRNYRIRVNHQVQPRDYLLKEGDRVTITPTKFEGA
jgi:hypothetical protein